MFKWFIGILIAFTIFSSPVQNVDTNSTLPSNKTAICMNYTKRTVRNILVTTNNVLEVIIRNIDRPSPTVPLKHKKLETQNF